MSEPPLISVVIPSVNGLPVLEDCLAALNDQDGDISIEILVVDRCGEQLRSMTRRRFPGVILLPVEGKPSIPAMRAIGIARARGRVIAMLEDHCMVNRNWCAVLEREHRAGHEVVGGAVENGSVERIVDWAAFFCEYSRFMPPVPWGVVPAITGNNTVYDRHVLERLGPALHDEVWEAFLHQRISDLGVPFHSAPDLVVRHKKEFGYLYFLAQRYHYSRSFAAMRLAAAPRWKRFAYACGAVLLPALLMSRITADVFRKRFYLPRFLLALPVLATFLGAWSVGEAVGALSGGGRSLAEVE